MKGFCDERRVRIRMIEEAEEEFYAEDIANGGIELGDGEEVLLDGRVHGRSEFGVGPVVELHVEAGLYRVGEGFGGGWGGVVVFEGHFYGAGGGEGGGFEYPFLWEDGREEPAVFAAWDRVAVGVGRHP